MHIGNTLHCALSRFMVLSTRFCQKHPVTFYLSGIFVPSCLSQKWVGYQAKHASGLVESTAACVFKILIIYLIDSAIHGIFRFITNLKIKNFTNFAFYSVAHHQHEKPVCNLIPLYTSEGIK